MNTAPPTATPVSKAETAPAELAGKGAEAGPFYRMADLARHFALPESTIRYYCRRFAAFLPTYGEGRRRRYDEQAIAVLTFIQENMATARTAQVLEQRLAARFAAQSPDSDSSAQHSPPDMENAGAKSAPPDIVTTHLPASFVNQASLVPENAALHLLGLVERQNTAFESVAATLASLSQSHIDIAALHERAQNAENEAQSLRTELAQLRALLISNEANQQEDLEQLRQWLTKAVRSYLQK